jgi:molybdopterin converting factor small subunit
MGALRPGTGGALSLIVRLPPSLAERIGISRIELEATSARGALSELSARFPALTRLLWQAPDEPNPVMLLFHANTRLLPTDFDRPLPDGAVLDIVPAIEAG